MAFTDMNDVEQELGEEKPPNRNGNRTFLIIAGTLGGIIVLALLCIGGLALFRYLPNQRATQNAIATKAAQDTAVALSASQTASVPTVTATATRQPTYTPTNTRAPTNTPIIVIAPTKSPTVDIAIATRDALLTQIALTATSSIMQASPTPLRPTTTALPPTGIGDELGTPGLLIAGIVLVMVIFLMRKLRMAT
jgi:hypothetical protein